MLHPTPGRGFSFVAALAAAIGCAFTLTWAGASEAEEAQPPSQSEEWIITGQVLDAVGAGIVGASIQVEADGDAKTEGRVIARTVSERAGDFRIKLPDKPRGKLFVRVKKERFAPFHAAVEFEPDWREAFVDVEMVGAMSVRGQVVEAATSRPVKDANVIIDIQNRKWEAQTDAAGRFEISGLPAGVGLLVVSRDGFAHQRQRARVEAGEPDARVPLQPEQCVRLRVVDDLGRPVGNAEVEVLAADDTFSATTDADGRTDLHGISRDVTEVSWRASHPDGVRMLSFDRTLNLRDTPEPAAASAPATSRPAIHTITLPRGGKVAGSVVDGLSGEPVSGARIVVVTGPESDAPMEWTDIEGRFEVVGVMPGPIVVAVQHPDYAPELLEDSARAGWTRTIPIRLAEGKPLAGVVVGTDGKGLDQVQVVCTRWRDRDVVGLRALTDDQGRFAFEHAPDGPIEFAFYRPAGGRLQGQTLTAGKTDYRFTLEAEPKPSGTNAGEGAARSGLLEVGKPAPDFAVTAIDGTTYRLSKLRGKYVFVDVWATWCPPCRGEVPTLKQLHADVKSRSDFVMLGISLDPSADVVKAFAASENVAWPLAAGPDSGAEAAAEKFGVKFIPFNFVVGPNGKILAVEVHRTELPKRIKELATPVEERP